MQGTPLSRQKPLHLHLTRTHRLCLEQRRPLRVLHRKAPLMLHQLHSQEMYLSHPYLQSPRRRPCHRPPKLVRGHYRQSTTRPSIIRQLSLNRILRKRRSQRWTALSTASRLSLRPLQIRDPLSISLHNRVTSHLSQTCLYEQASSTHPATCRILSRQT